MRYLCRADFQCVQHGGRCQSLATCEGGQYRAGLCAGHAQRKCCIAGLEPLAHSFPGKFTQIGLTNITKIRKIYNIS